MRVFITGPLGYIGKSVAEAFRNAGHHVMGLVRSEEKAKKLLLAEMEPVLGDLSDPQTYKHIAEHAEVIVHCGFESSAAALDIEMGVIDTLLNTRNSTALSSKALLYTSGVWVMGNTGSTLADEASPAHPLELVRWRYDCEERIIDAASAHFRTLVLRPGVVYGAAGGLTSLWFSSTLRGSVEIVGDGSNHWSMIHQQDLARAYVLAAESELNGAVLNIVDNTHATVMEMALAVSDAAGLQGNVVELSRQDAEGKYGKMVQGLLVDQYISNERAMRLLGWYPRHRSFTEEAATYYKAWKAAQTKHL